MRCATRRTAHRQQWQEVRNRFPPFPQYNVQSVWLRGVTVRSLVGSFWFLVLMFSYNAMYVRLRGVIVFLVSKSSSRYSYWCKTWLYQPKQTNKIAHKVSSSIRDSNWNWGHQHFWSPLIFLEIDFFQPKAELKMWHLLNCELWIHKFFEQKPSRKCDICSNSETENT